MVKIAQQKGPASKFANKGGGMRKVAKTIRGVAAQMEASLVSVRKEDVALKPSDVPLAPRLLARGDFDGDRPGPPL